MCAAFYADGKAPVEHFTRAAANHRSQSLNGKLTKIEDIVPIVKFLAAEGWWITGQTIFANGGYPTR